MPLLRSDNELDQLFDRCRRQDAKAWEELVRRFQNLVYSVARRYRLNEDDCADVFQATFQSLYRSLDRIEEPQTLPKWLAVTASRESLRIKRINDRSYSTEDHGFTLDEVVAHEERSAEQNALDAIESDSVRAAIMKLGDRCKDLLSLLYLEDDVAYQEISEKLSMPIGAIGPTRARCLDKLRKDLKSSGFFE